MLLIIAAVVAVGIFVVGYTFGKTRGTEHDKIKNAEYKQMVRDLNKANAIAREYEADNVQFRSALKDIAAGRGAIAEITAASALQIVDNSKEF